MDRRRQCEAASPCRPEVCHGRARVVEGASRIGRSGHAGRDVVAGHAQRVAIVGLVRVREAEESRTTRNDPRVSALVVVGHDRAPAAGKRRAALERPLVHVAETVGIRRESRSPSVLHDVAIMVEPHVVAQLVRERAPSAAIIGDSETKVLEVALHPDHAPRDAAHVVVPAAVPVDDQMHEVGAVPIADRVDLVHHAVTLGESIEIVRACCSLGVIDGFPRHKSHPLNHPAVRIGLVGLGDHEVDQRLDGSGPALGLSGGRRVEHCHVDHGAVIIAGGRGGRVGRIRCAGSGWRGDQRLALGRQRRRIDLANGVQAAACRADTVGRLRCQHRARHNLAVDHQRHRSQLDAFEPAREDVAPGRRRRRPFDNARKHDIVEQVQRQRRRGRLRFGVHARHGQCPEIDPHHTAPQDRDAGGRVCGAGGLGGQKQPPALGMEIGACEQQHRGQTCGDRGRYTPT